MNFQEWAIIAGLAGNALAFVKVFTTIESRLTAMETTIKLLVEDKIRRPTCKE